MIGIVLLVLETGEGHVEVGDDELALALLVLPHHRLAGLVEKAARAGVVAVAPELAEAALASLLLGDVPSVEGVEAAVAHDDAVLGLVVADAVAAGEALGILEDELRGLVGAVGLALGGVEAARAECAEVEMALLGAGEAVRAGVVLALKRLSLGLAEEVGVFLVLGLGQKRHGLRLARGERNAVHATDSDAVLAVEVEVCVGDEHVALVEADGVCELDVVHRRLDAHGLAVLVEHNAHHAAGVVLGVEILVVAVVEVAVLRTILKAHRAAEAGLGRAQAGAEHAPASVAEVALHDHAGIVLVHKVGSGVVDVALRVLRKAVRHVHNVAEALEESGTVLLVAPRLDFREEVARSDGHSCRAKSESNKESVHFNAFLFLAVAIADKYITFASRSANA